MAQGPTGASRDQFEQCLCVAFSLSSIHIPALRQNNLPFLSVPTPVPSLVAVRISTYMSFLWSCYHVRFFSSIPIF